MNEKTTVVFIHGDGGPGLRHWQDTLDARMRVLGLPSLAQESDVDVVNVRYDHVLDGLDDEPAVPRTDTKELRGEAARVEYELRQAAAAEVLARFGQDLSEKPLPFPDSRHLQALTKLYFTDVKKFTESPGARRRTLQAVLDALPDHGRVVIIGHSLGSVVALAAVTRLPDNIDVPLLLTIGSPLALDLFAKTRVETRDHFPYGRVGCWVNVYGTRDPVTGSRGVAARHPQALDYRLDIGVEHSAIHYLDSPAVATLISTQVFPPTAPGTEVARTAAEDLVLSPDPALMPILLRFQWLHAWADWARRYKAPELNARLQRAIHLLATDIEDQRLAIQRDWGEDLPALPNLRREAALSVSSLDIPDRVLLAQLVFLSQTCVETPLKVGEHKGESRPECRRAVWTAVRPGSAGRRDAEKASNVVGQSISEAEECFARTNYWPWVAAAGGLALLALTGVGLAFAAPAGLAGAAAITSTLAAFGPGGMVGGVATVAALTGTGSAAAASGVARGMSKSERKDLRDAGKTMALAQVLSEQPEGLRGALISMLATARACQLFYLDDPGSETWDSIVLMEDACTRMADRVRGADDGSKGSPYNHWREKADDCRKALTWMSRKGLGPQDVLAVAIDSD